MKTARLLAVLGLAFSLCATLALAHTPAQNPSLGLVAKSMSGHIGNAAAAEGACIYSGDYLTTDEGGSLLVRVGPLSLELQASSAAHIYSAPYGAIVELDRGTALYTTPGGRQNLVIVAADVRVTPVLSLADLGRVTIDDSCNVSVYSQRGQANVQVGSESRIVEEGTAYRVRVENQISYREYLSPDASDYHNYHEHTPCAPVQMAKGHAPIAAGQSRFMLVVGGVTTIVTGVAISEALESPARP